MSRAVNAAREAVSAVASSLGRRGGNGVAQAGPSRAGRQTDRGTNMSGRTRHSNFVILNDIPTTASAKDVLRILQQLGVVKSDFPMSSITMPPPSFPRRAALTKSIHLTLDRNPDIVRHAYERLQARPPFPDLSGLAHGRKPSNNLGMRPIFPLQSTDLSARAWVESQIRTLPTSSAPSSSAAQGQKHGAHTGWNASRNTAQAGLPDVDWCMDTRARGRRVVVKGLPGMLDQRFVRLLGEDCGVEQGHRGFMTGDDVKQLPASMGSFTATWVLTTDSVAGACRLVRKLNRQYYNQARHHDRYPLRAEIAW